MNIDAFILVGGRSSRFGSDKANVVFGEKSLLEKTVGTIKTALDPKRVTLVAANDSQLLGSAGSRLSLPFIFDIYGGHGPFGALHAALAYAQTDWIFVIACDYPFVSAELIAHLAAHISDDLDAIAPVQPDGRVQPLLAFYRVKPVLKVVAEPLINNRASPPVRTIFDKVRSVLVTFESLLDLPNAEDIFLNMNTPGDLERATKIAQDSVSRGGVAK